MRQQGMPFYKFEIEVPHSAPTVAQRIRDITRDAPGVWKSVKEAFEPTDPNVHFIGQVGDSEFRIHRDVRRRNSFLPRIRGRIEAAFPGSRVTVNMSLHPVATVFLAVWLSLVGLGALSEISKSNGEFESAAILLGMFLVGVLMTLGGFYPEAIKARRLLEENLK
jgi:hypothetical protein